MFINVSNKYTSVKFQMFGTVITTVSFYTHRYFVLIELVEMIRIFFITTLTLISTLITTLITTYNNLDNKLDF